MVVLQNKTSCFQRYIKGLGTWFSQEVPKSVRTQHSCKKTHVKWQACHCLVLGLGDREISGICCLAVLAKLMNSDFSEQPCVKELCKMIDEDIQCLPLASAHIHTCMCTYAHEHTPGCFELHLSRLLREGTFLFAGPQESSHASSLAQLYLQADRHASITGIPIQPFQSRTFLRLCLQLTLKCVSVIVFLPFRQLCTCAAQRTQVEIEPKPLCSGDIVQNFGLSHVEKLYSQSCFLLG